jgi:hypothetical protein
MSKRPKCDTVGCGRTIPIGGGGHPEICPKCLLQIKHDNQIKQDAIEAERARLRVVVGKAISLLEKSRTNSDARIAYEFMAHQYLDELIAAIK